MKFYKSLRKFKKIEVNLQRLIKHLNKIFKAYPIIFSTISGIVLITLCTLLIFSIANLEWFELKSKNELGDAFGGLTNPVIAFFGVIVTFLAFYIQYKFNKQQSELILKQNIEFKKEQFDRKFFELLKMHSENVKEFNIANKVYGRKTFVSMLNELKIIHLIVRDHFQVSSFSFEINEFAYSVFFDGLKDYEEYEYFYLHLSEIEKDTFQFVYDELKEIQLNFEKTENNVLQYEYFGNHFELQYYPLDGHSHRLGHYYRHLHNFVQMIDNEIILSHNDRKKYIGLIRAQLSDYEQALLYCNSISWFKDKWVFYFEEYQLIKNLRIEMVSLFFDYPEDVFRENIERQKQKGIKMFEWVKLDT